MKRFLKVLVLLVVALFALVSGVDVTLDHISGTETQSAFTCYNPKGQQVVAYNGDVALGLVCPKPQTVVPAAVQHRTVFTPPVLD